MYSNLNNIRFRFRFFKFYILFGFVGLLIEFSTRNILIQLAVGSFISTFVGVVAGILFAYWSNIKFNFQIPPHRLKKALFLFILISIVSKIFQSFILEFLNINFINYEFQRIITAGMVFIIFYLINVNFTFSNSTQLGIAIYASFNENIMSIYQKVGQKPDFIQIDLVDDTVYKNADTVNLGVFDEINKYWPDKFVELHLMSLNPEEWINKLEKVGLNGVDLIIFHEDIKNILDVFKSIKKNYKDMMFGIFYFNTTGISKIKKYAEYCDQITVMGISKLGFSGQEFSEKTYSTIKKIDNLSNRKNFILEVDGGVNSSNYFKLKVDKIVSGSSVLLSKNAKKTILEFKNF